MKKNIIFLLLLIKVPFLYGQNKQLKIIYSENEISKNVFLSSKYDDFNLKDPHGYVYGEVNEYFHSKIILENLGNESLLRFYLVANDNDRRRFESITKYLQINPDCKGSAMLGFYNYWKDWMFHADSYLKENQNPFYELTYLGYGLCGSDNVSFSSLANFTDIPSRNVPLNGHSVSEYYYESDWHIMDADQNVIYLELNNSTLASYEDIVNDPFIGIRTKAYGKYQKENIEKSWANTALFEHVKQLNAPLNQEFSSKDYYDKVFDLFPKEKIIFYYDQSPEVAIGTSNITAWGKAKDISLGIIKHVNLPEKRCQSSPLLFSSAYPIYKIINNTHVELVISDNSTNIKPGDSLIITDKPVFSINFDFIGEFTNTDTLLIFSQGSKNSFPILKKRNNKVRIIGEPNKTLIKVTYEFNDIKLKDPPQVTIHNEENIFCYKKPEFQLKIKEQAIKPNKIWWQISQYNDFRLVIPNFDCVQNFTDKIVLSEIGSTFLNNNKIYYFRVKIKTGEIWSDWSMPFRFSVVKPEQPVVFDERTNKDTIRLFWQPYNKEYEYLIFSSNSKDFVPEVYYNKHINELDIYNGIVSSVTNNNLIAIVNKSRINLECSQAYYRIIARKDGVYSVPSILVSLVSKPPKKLEIHTNVSSVFSLLELFPPLLSGTDVLQTRHHIENDDSCPNGYRDIYHASRIVVSPGIGNIYSNVLSEDRFVKAHIKNKQLYIKSSKPGNFRILLLYNENLIDNWFIRLLRKIKWLLLFREPARYYAKYYDFYPLQIQIN